MKNNICYNCQDGCESCRLNVLLDKIECIDCDVANRFYMALDGTCKENASVGMNYS